MKKIKIALMASLLLVCAAVQAQQTQVIAHRGFWDVAGSAQNSIRSLVNAAAIGSYGSEADVWLTKDGEIVLCHDGTYKGVTIQDATLKVCQAIELDNGEPLPTFQAFIDEGKKLDTRLIVELKSHRTPEQETEAVQKIVHMIADAGLDERTEYISFSQHATREFIRLAPKGTPVYYLEGDLNPKQLKEMGCSGADYHLGVFKEHPEWIDECHQLGMKVNVWTVNGEEDMKWCIKKGIDFITTNDPLLLQDILRR